MRALVVLLLLGGIAAAAGDNRFVAREAFREGTRQYDLGDYQKALELFKKAYLNYEEPAILYNLAQCSRMLADKPEAVKLYKSYLRKVPDAPNRPEVERIISRLESEIEHERATRATPPQGTLTPVEKAPPHPSMTTPALTASTPAAAERTPVYKKWWLWTTVGVVVAAGVGVGLGVGLSQPARFNPTLNGFGPGMKSSALESR